MNISKNSGIPHRRNGGTVTVIAEGRVNPGEVSRDGQSVVYGEFKPGQGETVHRWQNGESIQLNNDGHSSYQARCNEDASVVVFHRYSLKNASDENGNWDIGKWEDGKVETVASGPTDEASPDIDDSGETIVYDKMNETDRKTKIMRWKNGETQAISDGKSLDLFSEVSGDGERIIWRRDINDLYLQDQNGVNKPISIEGQGAASVMLDQQGDKILYASRVKDGDQDLFLKDLSDSSTIAVSAIKGMDEYNGYLSGDGQSVVFTGIDRRKEVSDMNVYVWNQGKTEQLTWNDGSFHDHASISHDGTAVSWFSVDLEKTSERKVYLWQKDEKPNSGPVTKK